MKINKLFIKIFGLMLIALILTGCSNSRTITIKPPSGPSSLLTSGAGDDFSYYALAESPPESWEEVSGGTLRICNTSGRPPLIPENVAMQIDGGGFQAGTLLTLEWTEQPGSPDSSELGISEILVTIGITYEGCIEGALEAMESGSTILLTETDSTFDGKDALVPVEFE